MLKMHFHEETPRANPRTKLPPELYLYCVWHDSVVIPAFAKRHRCTAALTSRHADGSFVAYVLRSIGVSTIRGSTNHMGAGAMRQLMRAAEDKHIGITPDGPRGPRRQMSTGIAFLASRTGRAVVPTACSCVRCWSVPGTWTNLIIPKPFTHVYVLTGQPIIVPRDLGRDQLQPYVAQIQGEMDRLNERAECLSEGRESK
jgi:lysophospholipid acyltransferase (LPLAT)-like uncharacterized protein